MDQTKSFFVYSPPKSNSHGHTVRDKNVRRATQSVIDSFVNAFNATPGDKLQLTLNYDKKNELEKAHKTIDKLTEFLGPSRREWDNAGFEHMENTVTWEIESGNILNLLDYLATLKEGDYLPFSKFWIFSSFHYGQSPDPYGLICLSIQTAKLFVSLHLIFPYSIDDNKCYELLSEFQRLLPFKLNGNHFRRLGPSKRGYGQWKLDEETQTLIDKCLTESKVNTKGSR